MLDHRKHIGPLFRHISNVFEKDANNLFRKLGLTASQVSVMVFLLTSPKKEINQKDIEKELGLRNPTVTGILKRMAEKRLITSAVNAKDRRYRNISLTKKALVVNTRLEEHIKFIESLLIEGMKASEVQSLKTLLHKVLSNLNRL